MESTLLTLEDLKQAFWLKFTIAWHPEYNWKKAERSPFTILSIDESTHNAWITLRLKSTMNGREFERNITSDGKGFNSEKPMFTWPISGPIVTQVTLTIPKNNDRRNECAFCGAPTRKAGGGIYDICTKCGK